MRSGTDSVNDNDDFFSGFSASTCPGDNVCGIFDNEDEITTEDSIVWVNTNKTIWGGRVVKFPYSDWQKYSNH